MNEFILAWVLVVSPSSSQNSPIISAPVADLSSCERMRAAMRDSSRVTQCVEVKIPVVLVPKVEVKPVQQAKK
jgi:hypothetical protein